MTQTPWPRIVVGQRTDPGRNPAKQVNEDSSAYQETPLGHLLVVCDGMGGHSAGKEASSLAIATIFGEIARAPAGSAPGETLRAAIRAAGQRVYDLGGPPSSASRPGSTCAAILMHPLGTEVAHIGDSRVYVVRGGQIWPLTRDHSMVQQMVDAGLIRKEDAASHPDANKITRALGIDAECNVELRAELITQQAGDLFLLVSDGVYDVVKDSDLLAVATLTSDAARVPQLCDQVVQLANARGGPDNITILAALVTEPGLWPRAAQPRQNATIPDEAGPAVLAVPRPSGERSPPTPRAPGPAPMPAVAAMPPTTTPLPAVQPPAAAAAPNPAASALRRPRPGAGATVPLAAHGAVRGSGGLPGDAATGRSSAQTVVDDPQAADGDEPVDDEAPDAAPSRARRVLIGLGLFLAGAGLCVFSLRSLLFDDEAPPPLVDLPSAPSAAPRGPSSAPSR